MSRLFNQAAKAFNASAADSFSESTVTELVTRIKDSSATTADPSVLSLSSVRRIRFPNGSGLLISEHNSNTQLMEECYRGLRTRLMRLQATTGRRSIVVTSASEGDGKTLTTANLALCYAQLPKTQVLLIDADLRNRGLSVLSDETNGVGLAEVLAGQATLAEAVVGTDIPRLYVVPAGQSSASPPELFAGTLWKQLLATCAASFTVILVDSPPIIPLPDFELISAACDGCLMVVRALRTSRELLQTASRHLDAAKLQGVVFNGTDTVDGYGSYRRYLTSRSPR